MTPRQIKITEKVLSLIDWLETDVMRSKLLHSTLRLRLQRRLDEIKLESFAAEQLEEED